MLEENGCWNKVDDVMVPDTSPVADRAYWRAAGMLIALVLLEGDSAYPVSPMVIYALLSNIQARCSQSAVMNLSLCFISQLYGSDSKAQMLLPWMIVPPNVEWRDLPVSHQLWIRELLAGLDLQVSGQRLPV